MPHSVYGIIVQYSDSIIAQEGLFLKTAEKSNSGSHHRSVELQEVLKNLLFVRELDFSAFGGILVTRTTLIREFQFPNQLNSSGSPEGEHSSCGEPANYSGGSSFSLTGDFMWGQGLSLSYPAQTGFRNQDSHKGCPYENLFSAKIKTVGFALFGK